MAADGEHCGDAIKRGSDNNSHGVSPSEQHSTVVHSDDRPGSRQRALVGVMDAGLDCESVNGMGGEHEHRERDIKKLQIQI